MLESLKAFIDKKSWEGSDLGELWTAAAWAQDFISDPSSVHSSIPPPPPTNANLWNLCLWLFLLSLPMFPCRIICRTLCIFSSFRSSLEHCPWSVLPSHSYTHLLMSLCPLSWHTEIREKGIMYFWHPASVSAQERCAVREEQIQWELCLLTASLATSLFLK